MKLESFRCRLFTDLDLNRVLRRSRDIFRYSFESLTVLDEIFDMKARARSLSGGILQETAGPAEPSEDFGHA